MQVQKNQLLTVCPMVMDNKMDFDFTCVHFHTVFISQGSWTETFSEKKNRTFFQGCMLSMCVKQSLRKHPICMLQVHGVQPGQWSE